MPTHVRDDGSRNARIVLIGEAPGKWEEIHGRPFVGPSGGRLEVWWRMCGLTRGDFYITNVLPWRPENIDKVPREIVEQHIAELHERLAKLEGPVIIVPTGNYALYALTGKGKVSWHKKDGRLVRPGIMDWRGSVLTYTDLNGRECLVIPTIHPAHILRTPSLERRAILDWRRIADVLENGAALPKCHHHINPTIEDVEMFTEDALAADLPLGLDIETPKGKRTEFQMLDGSWKANVKKAEQSQVAVYKSGKKKGQLKMRTKPARSYIGCVGLSYSPDYTITVPLTLEYWKSRDKLARAKAAFQRLLDSQLSLVVQNGVSFDLPRLMHDGYTINLVDRLIFDTRAMHHCLDPRDDHDLAYMASILTFFPFWKHEAKDPDEITKYASNSEALWTYCGIDVASMLTIFYELMRQLKERGLEEFYHMHYTRLVPAVLDMTMHGIAVDDERRAKELDDLNAAAAGLQGDLVVSGMPLVAKKGLSNDRLKYLLYGARGFEGARGEKTLAKLQTEWPSVEPFKFPPMRKKNARGEKSITVDEVTLRKLILKYPGKLKELGTQLLDYRRNRKKAEFLDGKALDIDRRLRCSYSFVTEAGRFASSSTPWGTGRNLQNIDRELRFVFIPDKEAE